MKKILVLLLAMTICLSVLSPAAFADNAEPDNSETNETAAEPESLENTSPEEEGTDVFNWAEYSLEELQSILEDITNAISEKQRQYAIEHGDRKISLSAAPDYIYTSKEYTLEATVEKVLDTAPEETKLLWKSSDESIATVSSKGTVKGVGKGEAVITCYAEDNELIFADVPIEVVLPVTSVAFDEQKASILMFEGETCSVTLTCTVLPEDAFCKDVTWISSDEAVATVDENGVVSAVSPGRVTITARSLDEFSSSPREAKCTVTVSQAASSVALDQNEITLNKGSSFSLAAAVLPENTSDKSLVWESSDPEIVTVSNGQIRGIACGNATVTCTTADGSDVSASCDVTVIQMVTGIKLKDVKSTITLNRGSKQTLVPEIAPEDATEQSVNWESSDSQIVSVTDAGIVTAVNGGTATITCTATDGSEKAVSIDVFVPSISVENEEYTVTSKEGLSFTASYYGAKENFDISSSSSSFNVDYSISGDKVSIQIIPLRAGSSTITLRDRSDSKNDRTIKIVIDHSAVYDSSSYPVLDYTSVMRNPNQYDGVNCSVTGKVLQVMKQTHWFSEDDYVVRIGTSGWGYYDNVYYVTISASAMDENIIEDDMVTVYGVCTGTYTYSALFGNSITIPAVTGEKVIIH